MAQKGANVTLKTASFHEFNTTQDTTAASNLLKWSWFRHTRYT